MIRAAILVRLSKEDAQGKRAGIESTAVQLANARAAIAAQGWVVAEGCEFVFDGVSGADMGPRLDAVIATARAGRFDVLVARDLDRLVREAARQAAVLVQLSDAGARVWTYTDGSFAKLGGFDYLLTAVRGVVAEEERRKTGARVREALRARAAAGRASGRVPFGYRNVRDEATGASFPRIVEDEAKIVRRIAVEYLNRGSLHAAAVALNEAGVSAPSGGTSWSPQAIKNVVTNPIYRGLVVRGRTIKVVERGTRVRTVAEEANVQRIERPELAILDAELAARLDAALAKPRRRSWGAAEPRHLLSSFARCAICGASLTVAGSKGPSYLCVRHLTHGRAACPGIGYRSEGAVDAAVLAKLAPMLDGDLAKRTLVAIAKRLDERARPDTRADERRRVERAIADSERKQRNLAAAVAEGNPPAAVLGMLRDEEGRVRTLRAELARLDQAPPASLERRRLLVRAQDRLAELAQLGERGGVAARPVLAAVLGDQRFSVVPVMVRGERRWQLTARVSGGWLWANVVKDSVQAQQGGDLGASAGAHRRTAEAIPERAVHAREGRVHDGDARSAPREPDRGDQRRERGAGERQGRRDGDAWDRGEGEPGHPGSQALHSLDVRHRGDAGPRGLRHGAPQGSRPEDQRGEGGRRGEAEGHARSAWNGEQEVQARRQRQRDRSGDHPCHRACPRDAVRPAGAGCFGRAQSGHAQQVAVAS